ncbi:MAG: hypothetical protein ACM3NQ_12390 [Bacteroidales bacterium]
MAEPYCKSCNHPKHAKDCGVDDCGCVKYEPRVRKPANRQWVVKVSFLLKNRWTSEYQVRVKARALSGAAMQAVRAVRRDELPPRTRIHQAKLTIVPAGKAGI